MISVVDFFLPLIAQLSSAMPLLT